MNNYTKATDYVERRRYPLIRQIVDHQIFGIVVVILIVLSVILLVVEDFLPHDHPWHFKLFVINEIFTAIFVVELFMRWLVSKSNKEFIKFHWLDILAIVPLLRVFRLSRVFKLLRILRLFSLATIMRRRINTIGTMLEGQLVEYCILLIMVLFALVFGTLGLNHFEVAVGKELKTPSDAFWKSIFSLLTGEYASYPETVGGKVVFLILVIFGMGFFAMLTGTISAVMIEKLKENAMYKKLATDDLCNHIVICGFSPKVGILVSEFVNDAVYKNYDIVLVSKLLNIETLQELRIPTDNLYLVTEDFTHMETLVKAGIKRAKIAIILSEAGENRSTQDIDARTMLAALTIERLNPRVHTCAEIYHPEYADHLKVGGVNDVIIQGDVSGRLLARAAMQKGLLHFFKDLLSNQEGNYLNFIPTPSDLVGKKFDTALTFIHQTSNAILVGVKPKNKSLLINPSDYIFTAEDELLVIAPVRNSG